MLRFTVPSVLWRCWLGGRKGIRPVKNWVVGCWRGYLSGARCRPAYSPADATATHCLDFCFSKIKIGFTFLVPAHQGSPGKRAVKRVCVMFRFNAIKTWMWMTWEKNIISLITERVSGEGNAISRVRLSVCFHSMLWTNRVWPSVFFACCEAVSLNHNQTNKRFFLVRRRSNFRQFMSIL